MTISSTNWRCFLALCFCVHILKGQENLTVFWQPQLAVNYAVSQTYSHNFSIATRNYLLDNGNAIFKSRQLDIAHFSKISLQDNQSVAFGVQYRLRNLFENSSDELRFTQQYNITKQPLVLRFGHRFRSEQRILKSLTIYRFRYRFALDFPLKGEKLDLGEPFLIVGFENLWSIANATTAQFDTRLNSQLGWNLDHGFKLMFGLEYRLEDYTAPQSQNVFFFLTSAQLSL